MPHIASPLLESHFASQALLKEQLNARVESIELDYELHYSENKIVRDLLKKMLLDQISSLISSALDDRKISIMLVDIQNDFVLKDFALYAPGGENTITRNMALLDAFNELITEKPELITRFEIVTSQDAHILGRDNTDKDAQIMAHAYGLDATNAAIAKEQQEMLPINPPEGSFGLHCMRGTVGADIAKPIEDRLKALEAMGINTFRFGKVTFSGPEAGMLLKRGTLLSHSSEESIYDEVALSYSAFFASRNYSKVLITGICGDVCVQQAAEGLAQLFKRIASASVAAVVDACVHYLFPAGRANVEFSYREKGVDVITSRYICSNNPVVNDSLYARLEVPVASELREFKDHIPQLI